MYTQLPTLTTFVRGVMWGVHYAITGLHVYTSTGTSCGSFIGIRCVSVLLVRNALMCIRLGSTIFGQ